MFLNGQNKMGPPEVRHVQPEDREWFRKQWQVCRVGRQFAGVQIVPAVIQPDQPSIVEKTP